MGDWHEPPGGAGDAGGAGMRREWRRAERGDAA